MASFLKRKKKNKIYPSYEDEAPALLPPLAKPSTSATEGRRKNQVAPKNKIYPSYEDEASVLLPALAKPTPSAAEARVAEARPLVLPGLVKPQTSKQDPSQQRPSKKKSLEDSGPALPGETRTLKKSFMKAATLTTKALVQSNVGHVTFPHKEELTFCIIEVIREQPMASITNLHEAMENIIRLTALRPYMDPLTRSQLVQKITQKVFQLPSLQVMKIKAGSSVKATPSQDCYQETVYIWLNMLTSLLSEAPSLKTLQEILVHIKGWIDSTKISERQRAVKTTNALLKYVSEHLDFDVSDQGLMLQFQIVLRWKVQV
uniref:maestro heat-like repeat-containing protein family member 1 n=1 Tax=Podarcis muralis TaxID=64176 RepID=UPI00109F3272|nr:maestro heat-like repeat-containing protein family member 1 [Podarcis muralis]